MEKEYVQLPKGSFNLMMEALGIKEPKCDYCGTLITEENYGCIAKDCLACNSIICQMEGIEKFESGPTKLPIVKYQGELWYVDFRLKEKRNFYTAFPDRFDSGGIDEEYYRTKLAEGRKIEIIDCDGADPNEW